MTTDTPPEHITGTETTILAAAASIASDCAGRYSLAAYELNGRDCLSYGLMSEALRNVGAAIGRVETLRAVYFPDDTPEPVEPQSILRA